MNGEHSAQSEHGESEEFHFWLGFSCNQMNLTERMMLMSDFQPNLYRIDPNVL